MIAAHADPPGKMPPRRDVEPPPPKLRLIDRKREDPAAESRPPKAKPGLY